MTKEADKILNYFAQRDLHKDGFIHFTEFGDAIVWKDGFVRDEPVRRAIVSLTENGYVLEASAGLTLTEKGDQYIRERFK